LPSVDDLEHTLGRDAVLTGQVTECFALGITLADAFVALCGRYELWSLMCDVY